MDIRIETFRREHSAAFDALNRAWLVEHDLIEPGDEKQLRDPERAILAKGGEIFLALHDTEVIGTCAAIPWGPDGLELAKLVVAPPFRGRGLGRRLAERCVDEARRRKLRRVVLVSSSRLAPALRLYEAMGFTYGPVPAEVAYATADVYMELAL